MHHVNPLMGTLKLQSIGPFYSNMATGTYGTKRERLRPYPVPSIAVPKCLTVTAHP